jgi:hypothetical protein
MILFFEIYFSFLLFALFVGYLATIAAWIVDHPITILLGVIVLYVFAFSG